MVQLNNKNLEKQQGLELDKTDAFLVTDTDKIMLFDSNSFEQTGTLPITLLTSETREPTCVLELQKTDNEEFIGATSGKHLIKDKKKVNKLWVFVKNKKKFDGSDSESDEMQPLFKLYKEVLVKDHPDF